MTGEHLPDIQQTLRSLTGSTEMQNWTARCGGDTSVVPAHERHRKEEQKLKAFFDHTERPGPARATRYPISKLQTPKTQRSNDQKGKLGNEV